MKYDAESVKVLIDALTELAPREPVAELALAHWNEATKPRERRRAYGSEHKWLAEPVGYEPAGGRTCGPDGCPIWECGLCGIQRLAAGPKWREHGMTNWFRVGTPVRCAKRAAESTQGGTRP